MAAIADFAAMPTSRKATVFVLIAAVLGGLYYYFVFKGLSQDLSDADDENANKIAKNKQLEDQIPKYKELKTRTDDLNRIVNNNQAALPKDQDLPAFFEMLNRKVVESGVEVKRWDQGKEAPVETFIKVPVTIEMTGTFMQIKKFFASLVPKKKRPGAAAVNNGDGPEDRERIVSIENLNLINPVVINHEIVLTAKFTATTYRQEETAQPAGAPLPDGTPAKPAGAAPANKPTPPAATPAGAKARVEGAMEKSEQRNEERLKGGL
jgi:type IV pilus assembly protein PilO